MIWDDETARSPIDTRGDELPRSVIEVTLPIVQFGDWRKVVIAYAEIQCEFIARLVVILNECAWCVLPVVKLENRSDR